jgi:hypothetical protein
MLAAALLFATYSTFGPIGQDEVAVYVARDGSIVRVAKDNPAQQTTLTSPTSHRIAAIDVDGDEVIYGTSITSICPMTNVCPPAYCPDFVCTLSNTEPVHSLHVVSTQSLTTRTLVGGLRGVTEIGHDASWIYWLEPSSDYKGITNGDGQLRRIDKSGLVIETLAAGLNTSYRNQHPFVIAEEAIYLNSGGWLVRIPKSGGWPEYVRRLGGGPESPLAIDGHLIYDAVGRSVTVLDVDSREVHVMAAAVVIQGGGATGIVSVLGAGPGVVLVQEFAGWTHTRWHAWAVSDLCRQTATLLNETYFYSYGGFNVPALFAPPLAIDDRGIYSNGGRIYRFATPPSRCERNRAVRR